MEIRSTPCMLKSAIRYGYLTDWGRYCEASSSYYLIAEILHILRQTILGFYGGSHRLNILRTQHIGHKETGYWNLELFMFLK